jgi:plasmid maintenance system antidote protein VapI
MRYYIKGEVLKSLRERMNGRQGTTQKEIADKLGFSPQFINDVLGGRREVTDTLASSLGFRKVPDRWTRKIPQDTA